jgi:hypothetical protein
MRVPAPNPRRGGRSPGLRACLVVLALAACGGDEAPGDPAADGPFARAFRLAAPLVRIGGPGQELDRVYGGLLRPDGSLVVGNSGTLELRFYDAEGRLVSAAGRAGAGPGEFGSINWIGTLPGDSLIAFDLRHQRFSVWSAAGAFARTFMAQAMPPGPIRPLGVMRDGSILIAREGQYDPRGGPGVVRDSLRVMRMGPTGAVTATLGSFAGAEWLVYEHPASFRATQLPFGRMGHLAASGDHLFYGSSETGRITVYDPSGRQTGTFDLGLPRRRLSDREVSAFLEEVQDGPERSALARHHRENAAATAPLFTALRSDGAGNLWVRLSPAAGADSVGWMVLTKSGERLGGVRMHVGSLPLDIGGSMLLRETDADGVQHVTVRPVVP